MSSGWRRALWFDMASVVPTRRRTEPARRPRLARFARSHARGGGWSEISVEEAAEPTAPCRPARRPDVRVAQALGDLLVEVALGFLLHLGAERVRGGKREVPCDTHVRRLCLWPTQRHR